MPEGRQSPPPERQSASQIGSQTTNAPDADLNAKKPDWSAKEKQLRDEIEHLESNPKGPMEDSLEWKFSKEPGNHIGA